MNMNKYLDINPEVAAALAEGKPVVALESTIISHGMPYPQNVQTALNVERIIRENGAVPATIAVIGGRLKAGLSAEEIEALASDAKAKAEDMLTKINADLTDAEKARAEELTGEIETQIAALAAEFNARLSAAETEAKQYIEQKRAERQAANSEE